MTADQRRRRRQKWQPKQKTIKIKVVRCIKHMKPVLSNESCDDFDPVSPLNVQKQCMFCKYKN